VTRDHVVVAFTHRGGPALVSGEWLKIGNGAAPLRQHRLPQTNMPSLRATIRSTASWLTIETTASTALSPWKQSSDGDHAR
jgi:hypothetical protein